MPSLRYRLFTALFLLSLIPGTTSLGAEGKLAIVEKFADGNTELVVAHYTDPAAPAG